MVIWVGWDGNGVSDPFDLFIYLFFKTRRTELRLPSFTVRFPVFFSFYNNNNNNYYYYTKTIVGRSCVLIGGSNQWLGPLPGPVLKVILSQT